MSPDRHDRTMRIDIAPSEVETGNATAKKNTVRVNRSWRMRAAERTSSFFKLLESVYDAVLITDLDGKILECNHRAAEFFLQPASQLVGQSVITLISGATASLITTIRANLADKKYTLVEARCKRTDGTSFAAEIAVNTVDLDAHGQLCFFVRDVTIRHNALCALQNANERLQAHDRARLEFVSNVSHELRTPLTSMIYAVGNMLRGVVGPMPEKVVVYLERLESDCQRLMATVNDILDLRQIENKSLVLTKQVVPLGAVIRDGAEPLLIQADAKRITVTFDLLEHELFCLCDAQKMERVVLNIVGNAVKFTPADGLISVSLKPSPENPGMALLAVCDTGMGVPPEQLPKLSQRYFRAGDHVSGTGLGLAISREIVELHEGAMSFASPVPGTSSGTAVYVELPLAPKPIVTALSQEPETAAFLKQRIRALGYALDLQAEARATLAASAEAPPALLIVDARITDMNVRELVMQLREHPKARRLPIIVFGEKAIARADVELYRHFGIFYFALPWREPDLRNALAMAVRGKLR
ncbi:MAG: ATP-binding protein [Kiritimatiellaeota bacterium]|nr:ATP-binding protein [Kiritimatiellota bacterium]